MSNYIITGANSEIGIALADHLYQNGHELLLFSRNGKKGPLKDNEDVTWIDGVDFTKEEDLNKVKRAAEETFEAPFTLVHSVGNFWKHKPLTSTSFEEVKGMMNSHYITLFGVIKAVVPVMQKVKGGKIIAFSCNSVKYNYPDMAAFTSAKAAIECLIKCVANEQSKYGITANAFALPSIATEAVKKTKPEEFWNGYTTLEELAICIEDTIENLSPLINGTVLNLFKYNKSFYHVSYYDRNIIWEAGNETKTTEIL